MLIVEHREYLPTTGVGVVRYMAKYADKLTIYALKQRLAALRNGTSLLAGL